jgi:hypothetical protein
VSSNESDVPASDGFCTESGVIRQVSRHSTFYRALAEENQFVAAPLGQGFTVAEQLGLDAEADSGIRLEVYPCLSDSLSCTSSAKLSLDVGQSPIELGLAGGNSISMHTS